jgi:hypothetical protein
MAAIHGQWQVKHETLFSIKRSLPSTPSLIDHTNLCLHYATQHGHPLSLSHHNGQTQMTYSSPHLLSWIAHHQHPHLCLAKFSKIATMDKHCVLLEQASQCAHNIDNDG